MFHCFWVSCKIQKVYQLKSVLRFAICLPTISFLCENNFYRKNKALTHFRLFYIKWSIGDTTGFVRGSIHPFFFHRMRHIAHRFANLIFLLTHKNFDIKRILQFTSLQCGAFSTVCSKYMRGKHLLPVV